MDVDRGRELVEEAQICLRDAIGEISDKEARKIVKGAEQSLDHALYLLEGDFSED